jgi:DNA-binding response OmpR family regulator
VDSLHSTAEDDLLHARETVDEAEDLHDEPEPERTLRVLVYSDDRTVRRQVMLALGRRPAADLPALEYVEVATEPMVVSVADRGGLDLLILDGEAAPAGGMGICRQLKDEIYHCPPILVLVGRPQDAWLATWSRADGVSSHPLDAIALAHAVTRLLRARQASVPA